MHRLCLCLQVRRWSKQSSKISSQSAQQLGNPLSVLALRTPGSWDMLLVHSRQSPQTEVGKTSRHPQCCVLGFHCTHIFHGLTFREDADKLCSHCLWRDGEAFPICVLEQCTPTDMMSFGFKKVFELENVSKSIRRGYK